MEVTALINHILSEVESDAFNLPAPAPSPQDVSEKAAAVLARSKELIGEEGTNSAYYTSSEDRFDTLLRLTMTHVPAGGRILDIGNAPGYLAIMMAEAGYDIDGVNLSDQWNSTYPDPKYVTQFRAIAADVEKQTLPYPDNSFDAVVFTEVLEHIAIRHPEQILAEFRRLLKPGGVVIFSTPNVCNISNVVALIKGGNIFWGTDIFYGSTDRHNREWAPGEVLKLFEVSGFRTVEFFGMNDHANWRAGFAQDIYEFQTACGTPDHPLMRNTIVGAFLAE